MVAAQEDVVIVRLRPNKEEIDFDIKCNISEVKACLNTNGKFYILANKYKKDRGIFLMEVDEEYLCENENPQFIIRWKTSL